MQLSYGSVIRRLWRYSMSCILGSVESQQGTSYNSYNNGLFSSDSGNIMSKITDNRYCRPPYDIPLQGTHTTVGINLKCQKLINGLWLCHWQHASMFIQIFVVGSERQIFCAIACVMTVQGHTRSLILAPIKSVYVTSYYIVSLIALSFLS